MLVMYIFFYALHYRKYFPYIQHFRSGFTVY